MQRCDAPEYEEQAEGIRESPQPPRGPSVSRTSVRAPSTSVVSRETIAPNPRRSDVPCCTSRSREAQDVSTPLLGPQGRRSLSRRLRAFGAVLRPGIAHCVFPREGVEH